MLICAFPLVSRVLRQGHVDLRFELVTKVTILKRKSGRKEKRDYFPVERLKWEWGERERGKTKENTLNSRTIQSLNRQFKQKYNFSARWMHISYFHSHFQRVEMLLTSSSRKGPFISGLNSPPEVLLCKYLYSGAHTIPQHLKSVPLPATALAGTSLAGSSETAGSWRCSPESKGPERTAGRPRPGWPGCWGGLTDRPLGSQSGFSGAHHGWSCLLGSHVLQEKPNLNAEKALMQSARPCGAPGRAARLESGQKASSVSDKYINRFTV